MKPLFLALIPMLGMCTIALSQQKQNPSEKVTETGNVLILDNELLIEGDISRMGNQYSVKRNVGETLIPASRVISLVKDKPEAFEVMRKRANLRDPDERLRLARWGLMQQMFPEALVEAKAALEMRPNHSQTQILVNGLTKLATKPVETAKSSNPSSDTQKAEEIVIPANINSASYGMFVTKVQPILMNLCAICHATGKGGEYKLVHVFDGSNRKGSMTNFAATLARINSEKPQASPLLVKATTPHGDTPKQPIRDNRAATYKSLENWVFTTTNFENTPKESPFPMSKPISTEAPETLLIEDPKTTKRIPSKPPLLEKEPKTDIPKKDSVFGESHIPPTKKEPENVKDEFDPLIFNKQALPKK